MAKEKRITPQLFEGGYRVGNCNVCDVDDIIGTSEDLCSHHYSAAGLEYNYGHDIISLTKDRRRYGYYIGKDRFTRGDSGWSKEYALHEFAVYLGGEDSAPDLLLSHMKMLAKETGCSRIVCRSEGGNAAFENTLIRWGFEKEKDTWIMTVVGAEISLYDRLVIPKETDRLSFETLFFLREQGFTLDENVCSFAKDGESITVDRKTALCQFSEGFTLLGDLIAKSEYALAVLDALCQLMKIGYSKGITVDPCPKEKDTAPDILVDGMGVFIGRSMTFREKNAFRKLLKEEGLLQKYAFHSFFFDFEVGGERICLGFRQV